MPVEARVGAVSDTRQVGAQLVALPRLASVFVYEVMRGDILKQ